ncbi:MAG: DUF4286 family protein [Muribaculaceae bacterium]|nr:DUF4286 family protein [Muribaculaceae bacterium]MDE7081292.1 DUF4286 family protein [Muribaculaceae bacterium]
MYIYNVTFIVERHNEQRFLQWMRSEALPALVNAQSPARSPRLTIVAEVPGDPDFSRHVCNFAFQTEYESLAEAQKWAEIFLQPLLGRYAAEFGAEQALSFATVLEEIPL